MNRPVVLDPVDPFGPRFPKPLYCPRCRSRNVVRISYGYPAEETLECAKRGEIVLGGCTLRDPMWYCRTCEYEWPKERPWPTDEERLAFRLRCERHSKSPGIFARRLVAKFWCWRREVIEGYVLTPWLVQQGNIHRRIKVADGRLQYMVHFSGLVIRVRPRHQHSDLFEATCLRQTLSGTRANRLRPFKLLRKRRPNLTWFGCRHC